MFRLLTFFLGASAPSPGRRPPRPPPPPGAARPAGPGGAVGRPRAGARSVWDGIGGDREVVTWIGVQ